VPLMSTPSICLCEELFRPTGERRSNLSPESSKEIA
jgi:hypothetical protein